MGIVKEEFSDQILLLDWCWFSSDYLLLVFINWCFLGFQHHCRRCGGIFCSSCTQHRMVLRGQGDSPVRICEPCKQLEEAARFEIRHGHKNRAGRGKLLDFIRIQGCSNAVYLFYFIFSSISLLFYDMIAWSSKFQKVDGDCVHLFIWHFCSTLKCFFRLCLDQAFMEGWVEGTENLWFSLHIFKVCFPYFPFLQQIPP